MRGKTKVELWRNVLSELQKSGSSIRGIENKVFKPLKWSNDSLHGNNIKSCFLFCCLYPEDFSIEINELVQCWLAEGLLDECLNYDKLLNQGISIVEYLKDSCLLEHGDRERTVKMHDVVRDVAIWIASSEDGCKSLVMSGTGLNKITDSDMTTLKRVSLINNKIPSYLILLNVQRHHLYFCKVIIPLRSFLKVFCGGFKHLGS